MRNIFACLVIIYSCKPKPLEPPENRPPRIISIDKSTDKISAESFVDLICQATDLDKDSLTYHWQAEFGSLTDTITNKTRWLTERLQNGFYTIKVVVSDPDGGKDTATTEIEIDTKVAINSQNFNIADDGGSCTLSSLTINNMPPNAVVESMDLGYQINHPNTEELDVFLLLYGE